MFITENGLIFVFSYSVNFSAVGHKVIPFIIAKGSVCLLLLQRTSVLFATSMSNVSEPLVTPSPKNPIFSSGLHRYPQACAHNYTTYW